ncbi:MAG: hypothetical protein KDD63_17715, partial [Bacteroidetes bacterium]|nr:hypothetical protein [Bacteroidota bacterium]
DMDIYAAVWYLGRMGTSECLPILQDISVKNKDLHVHIHTAALIRCKDEKTIQDVVSQLPGSLKELYQHRKWNDYATQIQQIIHDLKPQNVDFILHTYLLSIAEPGLKPALFPILSQIPLKPDFWKVVRRIFKIAEMVDDYETLGILAANIQRKKPFFYQSSWGKVFFNNRWFIPSKELPKPDSSLAFSDKTRNYFIRRVIRNLYKAGNDQLESYCDYAAQILLNYSEKDKVNHPPDRKYNWNRETRQYSITETIYHKLGHIPFVYHILYAGGNRLIMPAKGKFRFEAGEIEQIKREEPFAELWNKYPGYAVEILSKSQLKEGVDFALRILKGRDDILELISVNHVIAMLSSPFEEVLEFALENIQNNAELFKQNAAFFIPAVLTNFESLHQWLRENVSEAGFKEEEKQKIIAETFVAFRQIEGEDVLGLPVETLMHCFPDFLSKLDVSYILSLFEEENLQLHLLAGRLLNLNQISLADLPPDLLTRMLHSSSEEVRAQGVSLLNSLSAEDLIDKEELFISLATSPESDLRQAAKELVGRLAVNNPDLRDKIFLDLYPILLKNTEIEGLHQDVYSIISTHLHPSIPLIISEIDAILKDNHREA